ncbi:efflux RND transporter periplasmic adaptor subunit [Gemmatimonas sp.]|uniref:efflux RND transporter periplasmic adaptor subunit n=1 Tax=Gemmatimonas sp. TaxID=1962908 RepID=UPI0035652316
MTRTRWTLVATLALAVAAVSWWWLERGSATAGENPRASAAEMPGMPGMPGMDMSTDGTAVFTAAQLRQFGVLFGTVEQRVMTDEVRALGTVMADETRLASVTPRIAGFVERLYVSSTGQPVRRGQPMAAIYSPEVLAAQQELLIARDLDMSLSGTSVPGVPASSGSLLAAARQRLRLWDVPESLIGDVLRTGLVQRTIMLYAPMSGVITERFVVQGQAVQAGVPLYTITDLSSVWVNIQLRETDASLVREGTSTTLEFTALPGRPYEGRVAYVYPTVGEATRTLAARIVVRNADGRLKPGMYATARLSTPARTALTVPSTAVIQTGERAIVFVDMGNGRLMPHDVELGRVSGEVTEVLAGLEPGQRVVTSAQFLLESESNLADVMKSMIGMGGGAGTMSDMPGMDMSGADTRGMSGAAATSRPATSRPTASPSTVPRAPAPSRRSPP